VTAERVDVEGGRHSFDFYCDVKTVCERTVAFAAAGTGGGL